MLKILSLYPAPDGEANAWHQGSWSWFVRTSGCTVGCRWCDTRYSWSTKRGISLPASKLATMLLSNSRGITKLTLTGGEPLEQPLDDLSAFIHLMLAEGYRISVETSGALPVQWLKDLSPDVALVVDWKPPSAQAKRMLLDNYRDLDPRHVIKIGVGNAEDYNQALEFARAIRPYTQARMVMSPVMPVKGYKEPGLEPARLIAWMRASDLPALGVGVNLQLHKFIYPEHPRDEEQVGWDWSDLVEEPAHAAANHL